MGHSYKRPPVDQASATKKTAAVKPADAPKDQQALLGNTSVRDTVTAGPQARTGMRLPAPLESQASSASLLTEAIAEPAAKALPEVEEKVAKKVEELPEPVKEEAPAEEVVEKVVEKAPELPVPAVAAAVADQETTKPLKPVKQKLSRKSPTGRKSPSK